MGITTDALLRTARRRAQLSQRELGRHSGVPQPTVSRIESGRMSPSFDLLARLLQACGMELVAIESPAEGSVDRTLIRENLRLSPAERLDRAITAWDNTREFRRSAS